MSDEQDMEQKGYDPELIKEFKKACEKAQPKIEAQIAIAREAIAKAERISEKYGVPFSSDITPLGMSYTPCSLDERLRDLDSDTFYDLTGEYLNEYEGWEHSSVC